MLLRFTRPRPFGFKPPRLALLLFLLFALPLPSQQPTYKVSTVVVNVPATVRNKHGQLIRDLKKEDFVLKEDGRPREIRYFALDNDLPLTLGLLVDTSGSQRRVLADEREASYAFLDDMLRRQDTAFIIHFDREAELLQDLTADRQSLQAALQELHVPDEIRRTRGSGPWPGGGGGWGGGPGTVLYDAVYLASNELMKKQQGRKALIVLSDGVDIGSMVKLERAVEAAQRADTIVYSILFYDARVYGAVGPFSGWGRRGGTGGGFPHLPDGKKVLEQISKETGGHLFEVSSKQSIASVYAQIADELRNQYNLGFAPGNDALGYHKIQLKTRQKDLIVQARSGYYKDR